MRQPTKASDLVSHGTILRAANRIVQSARSIAAQKRAGNSSKGIILSPVREANKTVLVDIIFNTDIAPEAPAYEWGSGLHDTKKGAHFIDIYGRNTFLLTFEGTNAFEGQLIQKQNVKHPGVKPRPFLAPAIKKHRPALKQAVREEVNKNLRISIKAMAIKI